MYFAQALKLMSAATWRCCFLNLLVVIRSPVAPGLRRGLWPRLRVGRRGGKVLRWRRIAAGLGLWRRFRGRLRRGQAPRPAAHAGTSLVLDLARFKSNLLAVVVEEDLGVVAAALLECFKP